MKNISIIGSGNIATHLAIALEKSIYQIYSRKIDNAKQLAEKVNAKFTNKIENIKESNIIILCVPDNAIKEIILKINANKIIHTSGNTNINIFNKKFDNYGVLYPVQTFNKNIKIDLFNVPICIEANNSIFLDEINYISQSISNHVVFMSSSKRRQLHIAATFASNFSNQMFSIADDILNKSEIEFNILMPLIKQTIKKINNNKPKKVLTGPAIRKDRETIKKHLESITNEEIKKIYKIITQNIIKSNE
tara:strand:+ start:743 stop:1489 length:747 start_codon:yes stop_codon:yes gene_type:complete